MIPVTLTTNFFGNIIYFSATGAAIAFIVSFILLINVSIKYNKIRKSRDASFQKRAYLMVIIYLILTLLSSSTYALVRTNSLTRIKNDQFTDIQCGIGFIVSYLLYHSSVALLYGIFIWRIKTTLKSSAYELTIAKWGLISYQGVSFCGNFVINLTGIALISFIYHVVMNVILLSMFVKGLWSINRLFISRSFK